MLRLALARFCAAADAARIEPLGRGRINDTYLVTDGLRKSVLQRINSAVFPEPARVAANFALVSRHLKAAAKSRSLNYVCAEAVPTLAGELIWQDPWGGWWRAQSYVEHLPGRQTPLDGQTAWQLGRVLARFHLLTADLDIATLGEPLPGFHVTPRYLAHFDQARLEWRKEVAADVRRCFEFADIYRQVTNRLEAAAGKGLLVRRTIHGDPKSDNIIFAADGQAVGLFDLDTVGPGLIHYDLGDCLRSCCNRDGEEGECWERVRFDLDICEAVLDGYLRSAGDILSRWDRTLLFDAILVITVELALRFLTDHLRGDVYFKVNSPGENLCRALGQFQLAESIAAQETAIRALVDRYGSADAA